jgi:hypothetical protein
MVDVTHHKMSEDNLKRLRGFVYVLAVVYLMTFLSGLLQATQFNFLNYIFFSLLFVGGFVLMNATVKSKATGMTLGFLILTGLSSISLGLFFVPYEWSRLTGLEHLEASIESLLYLITLSFWIAVIGSLVLIRRIRGLNSSQP